MQIENNFSVPLPLEETWRLLLDVRKIVPCMPGAELLEVTDPRAFKARVHIRLGPIALSLVGTGQFEQVDDANHRAQVRGQATDSKGRGGTNAIIAFALSSIPEGTRVDVTTNVDLSGSIAQYARGTGVIKDVATQLTRQFADALRKTLHQDAVTAGSAEATGGAAADHSAISEAPVPAAISGLSLLWRALCSFVRRLFGLEKSTN